jgi:hypothetical protein
MSTACFELLSHVVVVVFVSGVFVCVRGFFRAVVSTLAHYV